MSGYQILLLSLHERKSCFRWDDALPELDPNLSFYHRTSVLRSLESSLKHKNLSVMIEDVSSGKIVGVLPLFLIESKIFGNYITSTPAFNYGGFRVHTGNAKNDEKVIELLFSYAIQQATILSASYVQFRDSVCNKNFTNSNYGGNWTTSTEKVNMILTLPKSMSEIGSGNAKKRQKLKSQASLAVRKAQEAGEIVRQSFGGVELLDAFYSVFSTHMRDLGTPVYSKDWFKSLLLDNPGVATLTVAYINEKPMACGFLFNHQNGTCSIPWASALYASNPYSLNTYLYWNILDWAIKNGASHFDFGRSSIDSGTFLFKKQWGAEPQQCYWLKWSRDIGCEKDLSPSNSKFDVAIKVWQRLPLWLTNRLGPVVAAKLP